MFLDDVQQEKVPFADGLTSDEVGLCKSDEVGFCKSSIAMKHSASL